MPSYFVNASLLNLRATPTLTGDSGNVITRLKNREVVDVTDASNPQWYKVTCINRNPLITGYAASAYLKPVEALPAGNIHWGEPVNLKPNPLSRRDNHAAWQYPLSEGQMPVVDAAAEASQKIVAMHQIVKYLQVDKSARYQRDAHTYCNIYAYDYACLSGVFMPRIWWRDKTLLLLKDGQAFDPIYDVTVDEVSANGLFSWLEDWGEDYHWIRTYDLDDLQNRVNEGRVGVICAANINPSASGHICCVIPEDGAHTAAREGGKVICPLLSQAGAVNLPYYNDNKWWVRLSARFRNVGFWYI